jgi:hypothetical protein
MMPNRHRAALIVTLLVSAVFFIECKLAGKEEKNEPTSTTDVISGDGSTTTVLNFQSISGKAGWLVPMVIGAWFFDSRRKDKAISALILSIEQVGDASRLVKSCVRQKNNKYITKRVAKLCPKLTNGG